jgi:murE/murF fusion protein
VVLLAGKGHEDYQEIAGVKHPFSDQAHALARWRRGAHEHMFPAASRRSGPAAPRRRRQRASSPACTPTPARCRPATCSWRCKGERFDANDFLAEARARAPSPPSRTPAAARRLSRHRGGRQQAGRAGPLAKAWRSAVRALPLIAVTGSNGKTTVTQMIASILRAWQPDHAPGDAGQPEQRHRPAAHAAAPARGAPVGVIELGMNHPGEIAYLADIARPTVALVNNAQREHQEFMATVEAVARENGSVFAALPRNGTAVFPAGDEFTRCGRNWRRRASPHVRRRVQRRRHPSGRV